MRRRGRGRQGRSSRSATCNTLVLGAPRLLATHKQPLLCMTAKTSLPILSAVSSSASPSAIGLFHDRDPCCVASHIFLSHGSDLRRRGVQVTPDLRDHSNVYNQETTTRPSLQPMLCPSAPRPCASASQTYWLSSCTPPVRPRPIYCMEPTGTQASPSTALTICDDASQRGIPARGRKDSESTCHLRLRVWADARLASRNGPVAAHGPLQLAVGHSLAWQARNHGSQARAGRAHSPTLQAGPCSL